jgi:amino acid transporter
MSDTEDPARQPLLPRRSSGDTSKLVYNSDGDTEVQSSQASDSGTYIKPSRSIEDDVLPETATYGRELSWGSAYILVISRVIGSGIFATPGTIVKEVGSVGLSLSLWVVGAAISACGLAVALEYGCMLPRSGGDKVYLEFTYRYPRFLASTLVAVQAVLLGFTASNCIIFAEYVLFALDIEPTQATQKILAVGLLTIITIIHGCFLRTGIFIQNALGWLKIALVVFMIVTGLFVVIFRTVEDTAAAAPAVQIFSWDELWKDSVWNWGILSTALFKVFYSYAGLNNVNNVLNEVKNPIRTLKSVSTAALITACGLYLLINVAYFLVIPLEEIKGSGELVAALFFDRVFGPGLGKTILPLAIAVSGAGNVMVVTFAVVSSKAV